MMKFTANYLLRFALVLGIIFQFSSCENCDEKAPVTPLKENEKAFIANQPGDTLFFKDTAGKKYYLVCKSKALGKSGYYHTGHNNPCEDTVIEWEKLSAQFEGNVMNDHNLPISLQTRIEVGYQPADPGGFEISQACNSNNRSFFYLVFNIPQSTYSPEVYWGRTDEKLYPKVMNFGFIPEATLGGRKYQNLLINSISNSCLGSKPSTVGLDSVYYSTGIGLVRFTTVGGKKYQRVL